MSPRDPQRFGESDDETLRYLLSLKIILAADGLHPLEEHALSRGMELMGVPEDIRAAVQRFESRGADSRTTSPAPPPARAPASWSTTPCASPAPTGSTPTPSARPWPARRRRSASTPSRCARWRGWCRWSGWWTSSGGGCFQAE